MIFEKPSTRTRVSFDVGMRQLGGETIMLTGAEMQLGRGETMADTARVLSRYVDAIMIRILSHDDAAGTGASMRRAGDQRPDRQSHPCQMMADVMTFEEHAGRSRARTVAWVGDGNNVLASWVHAARALRVRARTSPCPPELAPKQGADGLDQARRQAPVELRTDPEEAVRGADCVVTDTWVSMGDNDGEQPPQSA